MLFDLGQVMSPPRAGTKRQYPDCLVVGGLKIHPRGTTERELLEDFPVCSGRPAHPQAVRFAAQVDDARIVRVERDGEGVIIVRRHPLAQEGIGDDAFPVSPPSVVL